MVLFKKVWTGFNKFKQVWTSMNRFLLVWPRPGYNWPEFGRVFHMENCCCDLWATNYSEVQRGRLFPRAFLHQAIIPWFPACSVGAALPNPSNTVRDESGYITTSWVIMLTPKLLPLPTFAALLRNSNLTTDLKKIGAKCLQSFQALMKHLPNCRMWKRVDVCKYV